MLEQLIKIIYVWKIMDEAVSLLPLEKAWIIFFSIQAIYIYIYIVKVERLSSKTIRNLTEKNRVKMPLWSNKFLEFEYMIRAEVKETCGNDYQG